MAEEVTVALRMVRGTSFGFKVRQLETGEHVIYQILEHSPAAMCSKVEIGDVILKINGKDVTLLECKHDAKIKKLVCSAARSSGEFRPQLEPQKEEEVYTVTIPRPVDRWGFGFELYKSELVEHVISGIYPNTPAALCEKVQMNAQGYRDDHDDDNSDGEDGDNVPEERTSKRSDDRRYGTTNKKRGSGKGKNMAPIGYDTLSSSTSVSEERSSSVSTSLVGPNSGIDNDATQPPSPSSPLLSIGGNDLARTKQKSVIDDNLVSLSNSYNMKSSQISIVSDGKDFGEKLPTLKFAGGSQFNSGGASGNSSSGLQRSNNEIAHQEFASLDGTGGGAGAVSTNSDVVGSAFVDAGNGGAIRKRYAVGFRTSRSEDHLQQSQRDGGIGAVVSIDIDEDVNSSLNTLLDPRYDAPEDPMISEHELVQKSINDRPSAHQTDIVGAFKIGGNVAGDIDKRMGPGSASATTAVRAVVSFSSSPSSSTHHSPSGSPISPTSVSSSVMTSSGGSREHSHQGNGNGGQLEPGATSAPGNISSALGCPNIVGHQQQTAGRAVALQAGTMGSGSGSGIANTSIGTDLSLSEAISSPDFQDNGEDLLTTGELMDLILSDPSEDSDSTILLSEAFTRGEYPSVERDYRVVIPVRSGDATKDTRGGIMEEDINTGASQKRSIGGAIGSNLKANFVQTNSAAFKNDTDSKRGFPIGAYEPIDETANVSVGAADVGLLTREASPPVSDDGSDVESLHSFQYSPKGVDIPSAERLAKRLFNLEGFKKSHVSRHLSKNNEFTRAVAEEYLKFFNFENQSLDEALRIFLNQFSLSGETQERERVLNHFSRRYLDCNPDSFRSQDSVHTLTCAIMLLNTDLHGPNMGRARMTCTEFIENLKELNDGINFPKDVLKHLYHAIKNQPFEWAVDDEPEAKDRRVGDNSGSVILSNETSGILRSGGGGIGGGSVANAGGGGGSLQGPAIGSNSFFDTPSMMAAVEYKKGYIMRKCCSEANNKRTPFGRRSWKMVFCTVRDLALYLHKDEHTFRKYQMSDHVHNAIRIHHALATRAIDYTKKEHVFRLQTADQSEFLFQAGDSKELQSWIDTINFVCAAFSAPPLEGGVGSQRRFQRPLLPSMQSKLLMREQLASHYHQIDKHKRLLEEHKSNPVTGNKGLNLQNYRDKEQYLDFEIKRYRTYYTLLSSRLSVDHAELGSQDDSSDTSMISGSSEPQEVGRRTIAGNIIHQHQSTIEQQGEVEAAAVAVTNNLRAGGVGNKYEHGGVAMYRSDDSQEFG
ncbi:PH and SEC7 domain-containing protein [Anopheles cruzii]|uniref:PH and SEC7 domain-containing protein n=1 Tax=Anopheles cruzii TaxID=68878 RepID=UPI0022EC6E1A|nr:PH and SEC7 domain-containing protein [Anopheles cruzii]